MGLELMPADGTLYEDISVAVRPNYDGDTLDSLAKATSERVTIGTVTALLDDQGSDSHGTLQSATWLDSGMLISASTRIAREQLLSFIAGFRPAHADAVIRVGEQITEHTLTMAVLDQASLTDGTKLSVRTDGRGATAICVEAPVQHCKREISESSLVGNSQGAIFASFIVNGEQFVYGWRAGNGQPILRASAQATGPASTTAVINDIVGGAKGQFIEVRVPAGEPPPDIDYRATVGIASRYGVAAATIIDY